MNIFTPTLSNILPFAHYATDWLYSIPERISDGIDHGIHTMAEAGNNAMAHTHAAQMSVGAMQVKSQPHAMMAPASQTAANSDIAEPPMELSLPAAKPPHKKLGPTEPMDVYDSFQTSFGLGLRTSALVIAASLMSRGRKALIGSVYYRGEQPEAFQTIFSSSFFEKIFGKTFQNLPAPADPWEMRAQGAHDTGSAYAWWLPHNAISVALDIYLLYQLNKMHSQGKISEKKYLEQNKLLKLSLVADGCMLADTMLFVGSFWYMASPEHSETIGLGLLTATQVGNVVAHSVMLKRNLNLIEHNKKREKETGEPQEDTNAVYWIQAGSLAAFLGSSLFLVTKATFFSDSISMANDILMNATHYPWWALSGLIVARGMAAAKPLIKARKTLKKAQATLNTSMQQGAEIMLDAHNKIKQAKKSIFISSAIIVGTGVTFGGILLSHPVVAFHSPWFKATGASIMFLAAMPRLAALFKRSTWQGGFMNGLGNFGGK